MDNDAYRPCVGIMVMNDHGLIFAGRRIGIVEDDYAWQMPQGGIDEGEDPYQAALRELLEETGISSVDYLATSKDWLKYDLLHVSPTDRWNGKYIGQKQMWYALRFTGTDEQINLEYSAHVEFSDWSWLPPSEIINRVVPFKRTVYEAVMDEFSYLTGPQ